MMNTENWSRLLGGVIAFWVFTALVSQSWASGFKVLVVMSYEKDFEWNGEIREGIVAGLGNACEIDFFHMNTKRDLEGGPGKAKEALALYQALKPDGVIASDDNAQEMFVVPYLRDKVRTPVMFCGVNADP